jgi:hypothetical protein
MQFVKVPVTTLERLIEGLESVLDVCYNVDETDGNCERTYPYAVGYSKGAIQTIVHDLKNLKPQGN